MHPYRSIPVPMASRLYEVRVGSGILAFLGEWVASAHRPGRAFLVHDAALPAPLVARAAESLRRAGFKPTLARIRATENEKTLHTAGRLLAEIAETRHERAEPVIALGGGIVGDVAGFVAATYRRGVPVVQCPTTLLAMVDASVGGKTGVNLTAGTAGPGGGALRKNLVGAFHQPSMVLADTDALESLPDREVRCGLAECVKHAIIASETDGGLLLDWTEGAVAAFGRRDAGALAELVAHNVGVKAGIVAGDEREDSAVDLRAKLNLGHTFGHAVETMPGLSPDSDPASAPLHHGEAVGLGIVAAARCAELLGLCDRALSGRVTGLIGRIGLPVRVSGLDEDAVLGAMRHDKKVHGGRLRLVLPVGAGVRVFDDPPEHAVRAAIRAIS